MRIFCIQCKRWFQTESPFVVGSVATVENARGTARYRGDVYACSGCNTAIVADFGQPYSLVGATDPQPADYRAEG